MIHVLTLTWNGLDKLHRLESGLRSSLDATDQRWAWHIRDNGSIDGTSEAISKWDNVRPMLVDHNRGNFAQGMNSLFAEAQPDDNDIIALVNNDITIGNDQSVVKMLSLLTDDVGMVGARILYPDSNRLQHAGVIFSKKYNYLPYHSKHNQPSDKEAERDQEMQAVTAAFCLVRAREYRQVCQTNASGNAGMDEKYFWCFEDIDAALSIKYNLGKKVMYCGSTIIYHEESASLKKNPVNKLMMPHNVKRFKTKWSGRYKLDD